MEYTVEQTKEVVQLAVKEIKRNFGHPIHQCLVWILTLSKLKQNISSDYWSELEESPRTSIPPEVDRLITAHPNIIKVTENNMSFYRYDFSVKE